MSVLSLDKHKTLFSKDLVYIIKEIRHSVHIFTTFWCTFQTSCTEKFFRTYNNFVSRLLEIVSLDFFMFAIKK